jgi:hypothetical protein
VGRLPALRSISESGEPGSSVIVVCRRRVSTITLEEPLAAISLLWNACRRAVVMLPETYAPARIGPSYMHCSYHDKLMSCRHDSRFELSSTQWVLQYLYAHAYIAYGVVAPCCYQCLLFVPQ